jgi:hypothetical protein
VADEAQLALADLEEERLLEKLFAREGLENRDPWVRQRVAEAFGRVGTRVDGLALARAIDPRDADTAAMLLWSIERRARAERLAADPERVARELRGCWKRNVDPRVRAALLSCWAAVDPSGARPLVEEGLADTDAGVRCSALEAWLELEGADGAGGTGRLAASVADPSPVVRCMALEGLERFPNRDGLHLLVGRLTEEERSALRWRALGALQRLTGYRHRLDPRPWRELLATLPEDWTPVAGAPAVEAGNQSIAFAGLPLLSDHVAFLVDFSGSLWRELEDGRSRKQVVDLALRKALESLPPSTRFNVIPFTRQPHPWSEGLVEASRSRVRKAIADFDECHERGPGNFFEAALLALADPELDTVVVLTDGVPTGGRRASLELIVELLVLECRYRRVAFDSILVDAPPFVARAWSALAERTGGRSIRLQME